MAMTRGTTIALSFIGVLGLGLLIAGVASASDTPTPPGPKPKPKQPFPIPFPDPNLAPDDPIPAEVVPDAPLTPPLFIDPIVPIKADPLVVPAVIALTIPITPDGQLSGATCKVDGERYDLGQWPTPEAVVFALRTLGFSVSSTLQSAIDKKEIKKFQAVARSMGLEGMKNSPTKFVDGIMGICSLRALTQAAILFNAGAWPGQ